VYFPGHIAAPYLTSKYLNADARIAIAAGLFPDVVDKFGSYVLRVTPDGRVPAHTLLGLATTLSAAWLLGLALGRRRQIAYAWGLGYASHLIVDLLNGRIPALWPFLAYEFADYAPPLERWLRIPPWRIGLTLAVEISLTVWALAIWWESRRPMVRSSQPSASPSGEKRPIVQS
jgi:hypothetical protein